MATAFVSMLRQMMSPLVVEVDISNLDDDGMLLVRRASFGPSLPQAGDRVTVVDTLNEVQGTAFMMDFDQRTGLVTLHAIWSDFLDLAAPVKVSATYGTAVHVTEPRAAWCNT